MKKIIIKILSKLFPTIMMNFIYQQLTEPKTKDLRQNEVQMLEQSERQTFQFQGFDIQTYKWEGGTNKILLIHGWEGQAGNFADLIEKLWENNFTVYAFDAPSHGFSSKGKTNLFQFAELVGILIKMFEVTNLVSHSFGGVATTYSLFKNKDLKIEKYVLLSTLDKYLDVVDAIVMKTGMSEESKKQFIKKVERENNIQTEHFNVSDFVREINVNKALIIHDKNDSVIPIERSRNVQKNWDICELQEIEGTGHFKMLKTDFVIKQTLDFLKS